MKKISKKQFVISSIITLGLLISAYVTNLLYHITNNSFDTHAGSLLLSSIISGVLLVVALVFICMAITGKIDSENINKSKKKAKIFSLIYSISHLVVAFIIIRTISTLGLHFESPDLYKSFELIFYLLISFIVFPVAFLPYVFANSIIEEKQEERKSITKLNLVTFIIGVIGILAVMLLLAFSIKPDFFEVDDYLIVFGIIFSIYLGLITYNLTNSSYNSKQELFRIRKETFISTMIMAGLNIISFTIGLVSAGFEQNLTYYFISLIPLVLILSMLINIKIEKTIYNSSTILEKNPKVKYVALNTDKQKESAYNLYDKGQITKDELQQLTNQKLTKEDLQVSAKVSERMKIKELKALKDQGIISQEEFTKLIIKLT